MLHNIAFPSFPLFKAIFVGDRQGLTRLNKSAFCALLYTPPSDHKKTNQPVKFNAYRI